MDDNEYIKRGVDYQSIDGTRTLPGKYYHSKKIYQEEVDKIFNKFWIYACRAEEISSIGDYKLVQVEDESIIITRDKQENIRALFNVCSHRGTQMCDVKSGNFKSKSIQCPYHA
jgi:phenylpropionate dioxygenase-like ring-hydroxylating dioxygenase large terminal subunit